MSSPILDPEIPFVGEVPGGLSPGKMLKVHGSTPPDAVRFAINYQLGPSMNPRDDIALHLSPRFSDGIITRNHIKSMSWGPEENAGGMWIQPGQPFEVIILCEPLQYKIAINGRHYTEFAHRLPYQRVTHLTIDGDVEIKSILFESIGGPPSARVASAPDLPVPDFAPPAPGGLYPNLKPDRPPAGGYGSPSAAYGGPGGYNPPAAYGHQPGYKDPEEDEDAFGSCLDKVGLAVGGLIAAGGVAAAVHAYNKKKHEHDEPEHEKVDSSKSESEGGFNLGALGAALASGLAANALQGDMGRGQSHGYPSQEPGAGGMLGSLLGALGGGGHQPAQPPPLPADPMGGFGSFLGGVLGGGGGHHQPSGGYQSSGGYSAPNQGSGDLLSTLGSSLFSSALDGLSKHKSHDDYPSHPPPPPPAYNQNYGPPKYDPPPPPQPAPKSPSSPPASGGGKLSAAEISKGLGLSDDED